jgi:hypothetical protein
MIVCLSGSVATVAGGRVYLNLGASTSIAVGDYFKIRDQQEAILDPSTGDTLGFVASDKGFVRIAEVQERMSIADVVEGADFVAGQAAARSAAPGDDTQCVYIRGSSQNSEQNSEPVAASTSTGAQPAGALVSAGIPAQATAAPSPRAVVAPVADAGPSRARYVAPSATDENPIGDWHLDGEETLQFWLRTLRAISPMFQNLTTEELMEFSMGTGINQWRDGLDAMAMSLNISEDGTFHIRLRDPGTQTLSTVDGTWRAEGILYVLAGTHVDGIEVSEVSEEYIKVGGGRLFGQDPQMTEDTAMMGMYMGVQVRWPNLSGGAFVRTAR